ncbi:ribonuclease H2 subunit C [Rhodnius prolixus]|uniref:Putative ribonuclease h1/h2 small subunit n=1 Tax=Rhodnius prolixus TaxID=13249 RepID=R4FLX4_RHOPR
MTVHLKKINTEVPESKVHSIPCRIRADDTANVSLYFKVEEEDGNLTSSFRGHPLDGKRIKVPENYRGMIFRELENEGIEGQDRNLTLTSRFDSFSYWNWNKIPSRSDPLISALDWLDVTQAIHDPV